MYRASRHQLWWSVALTFEINFVSLVTRPILRLFYCFFVLFFNDNANVTIMYIRQLLPHCQASSHTFFSPFRSREYIFVTFTHPTLRWGDRNLWCWVGTSSRQPYSLYIYIGGGETSAVTENPCIYLSTWLGKCLFCSLSVVTRECAIWSSICITNREQVVEG